jgi:hypothetical protein
MYLVARHGTRWPTAGRLRQMAKLVHLLRVRPRLLLHTFKSLFCIEVTGMYRVSALLSTPKTAMRWTVHGCCSNPPRRLTAYHAVACRMPQHRSTNGLSTGPARCMTSLMWLGSFMTQVPPHPHHRNHQQRQQQHQRHYHHMRSTKPAQASPGTCSCTTRNPSAVVPADPWCASIKTTCYSPYVAASATP